MFTSILAATDRFVDPDPVVATAARLAASLDVPWYLVHVLTSPFRKDYRTPGPLPDSPAPAFSAEEIAAVRREWQRLYSRLLAWSPPRELMVTAGTPWQEIVRLSIRFKSDLIVMGPHTDMAPTERILPTPGHLGSTAEGVMQRTSVPVLIINRQPCRPKPTFQKMLVGIDFSKTCEYALEFAARMARFYHAGVDLFHMIPIPPYPKYARDAYEADKAKSLARMEAFGSSWLEGVPRRYRVWGGVLPHRELLKCAAECGSDTMVLGSHAKAFKGKWYAGSTVSKISSQATCPVFVISNVNAGQTHPA